MDSIIRGKLDSFRRDQRHVHRHGAEAVDNLVQAGRREVRDADENLVYLSTAGELGEFVISADEGEVFESLDLGPVVGDPDKAKMRQVERAKQPADHLDGHGIGSVKGNPLLDRSPRREMVEDGADDRSRQREADHQGRHEQHADAARIIVDQAELPDQCRGQEAGHDRIDDRVLAMHLVDKRPAIRAA